MRTSTWILTALCTIVVHQSSARHTAGNKPNRQTITMIRQTNQPTLSPQERAYAIRFLKETQAGVFSSIKGLTETQLQFKPAAGKWSAAECIKHIAAAETTLWAMVEASLKQAPNPDKRADIKFTDTELVNAVEDRSHKSTTFAALEPANSPYKTVSEALAAFKENREKLIAFVQNTRLNLRNHVSVLPIGTYDAYQFILLISAHSNRHTQQIEEVKSNPDFQKQ